MFFFFLVLNIFFIEEEQTKSKYVHYTTCGTARHNTYTNNLGGTKYNRDGKYLEKIQRNICEFMQKYIL